MKQAQPLSGELDNLAALRLVAALWVVCHHVGIWRIQAGAFVDLLLGGLLLQGFLGVKFFFILSGFILTHVYGRRRTVPLREFLIARFARIYPVYLVALLVGIPSLLSEIHRNQSIHGRWLGAAYSTAVSGMVLTLLQAWWATASLSWNGVSWSLSTEAFFYLIFPILLLPLMKGWSRRALALGILGCLALEVFRRWGYASQGQFGWNVNPILRSTDFASGIALRLLLERGLRIPPFGAVAGLCLVLGGIFVPVQGFASSLLGTTLLQSGFLVLIGALATPRSGSVPSLWLRPLIFGGHVSYCVYLLHVPLALWWTRFFPGPSCLWFGRYLIFLAIVSTATHLLVERPARTWIRSWSKDPKKFAPG